jgi:predicted HTH domain antitoxin
MNKYLISISLIMISLSIFYLGYQIRDFQNNVVEEEDNVTIPAIEKGLLTLEEAAEYLSMSIEMFEYVLIKHELERHQRSSYPTYEYIPYIEVQDQKFFSKSELNQWIQYSSGIRQEIK